jgi:DNA modification methylase
VKGDCLTVADQASQQQFVDHPVQSVMSRTGSFPLHVAYDLLRRYVRPYSIVFDPFCGKGTSLLAARILGRPAYGIDIAPEAIVCTAAKLGSVTLEGLYKYVDNLQLKSSPQKIVPNSVATFFNRSTLAEILAVREILLHDLNSRSKQRRENATFVLAVLLGILHGHASYSLSISSAHAFSMSPGYVRRFAEKNKLKPPVRDVKSCLVEKISRSLPLPLPRSVLSEVKLGTALQCATLFPELVGKIDVILTSPPYLNAQTYAKDNWLRLWLLGYNYKELTHYYIQTGSVQRYGNYMTAVFEQLSLMLRPGGRLICVAGDVRLKTGKAIGSREEIFQTGTFLARLCASVKAGFRVKSVEEHRIPSINRYFHALSSSNGHTKRILVERVFVAEKLGI